MMPHVTRTGVVLSIVAVVACSSESSPPGAGNGRGGSAGSEETDGGLAGHGVGGAAGAGGDFGDGGDVGTSAGGGGATAGTGGAGGGSGSGVGGAGGAGVVCTGAEAVFASEEISHLFGPGQDFGQERFPAIVFGPPRGGGCCGGSTDVVSLGNGGTVTVGFSGNLIVDGPGPDFIVFENAFSSTAGVVFAELATVEVSANGTDWFAFPCTAVAAPYGLCAGWHPVFANSVANTLDPRDPSIAGGDACDLADVGVPSARYVRITDRPDLTGAAGVFDLDAVAIVNAACP